MSNYYNGMNALNTRKPIEVTLQDSGSDMLSRVSVRPSTGTPSEFPSRWIPLCEYDIEVEAELQIAADIVGGAIKGFAPSRKLTYEWKAL